VITIRVRASCVREQVCKTPTEGRAKTDAEEQRSDKSVENVMRAHGHAPRRHGRAASSLRRVGEEALEDRGAQAGPDQAFGNVRVRGVELMQVRVRLPLFEAEFDLPAEPIESGHQVQRERRARQIRAQPRHGCVASR